MEAKVDIRKLQLLNDRIAQVTDALNQVRLSVHGLGHTGAIGQPFAGVPYGVQPPYAFAPQGPYVPWGGQPMGFQHTTAYPGLSPVVPFATAGWPAGPQVPVTGGVGLQHTPYAYAQPIPYAALAQGLVGQVPGWSIAAGWSPFTGSGLSHSPELMEQRVIEHRLSDPNRILQTFPFCMSSLPPAAAW